MLCKEALKRAVRKGHLHTVKFLCEGYSVSPFYDAYTGNSPLHIACEYARDEIVEYFLQHPDCSPTMRVEAYELLAVSYGRVKYQNSQKCYKYLWLALYERMSSTEKSLKKEILPGLEAYENRVECGTLDALESIKQDSSAIYIEALLVAERMFAERPKSKLTVLNIFENIRYSAFDFFEKQQYRKALALMKRHLAHSLYFHETTFVSLVTHSALFNLFLYHEVSLDKSTVVELFEFATETLNSVTDIEFLIPLMLSDTRIPKKKKVPTVGYEALYLLLILLENFNGEKDYNICKSVYNFNKLNMLRPAIHLVCDKYKHSLFINVNFNSFGEGVNFPHKRLLSLLLKCGADANSVDDEHNTPLHYLVRDKFTSDQGSMMEELIQYGCHVDAVNKKRKTAYDVAICPETKSFLKGIMSKEISLKCLAARVVQKHELDITFLPKECQEYVSLH